MKGWVMLTIFVSLPESMATIPNDTVLKLPAAESRRRAAIFANHLRNCIASCKRTLVENLQVRTQ